jgi:hypothetical protein
VVHDRDDKLGFGPYVLTLQDIIRNPKLETPLTIGIFGNWGSGKTSLMRLVEGGLNQVKDDRRIFPIWFNAWLYSKEESLWRALVMQVLAGVRAIPDLDETTRGSLDELAVQLYRAAGPAELGHLSIATADLLKAGASGAEITLALQHGLDFLETVAQASQGDEIQAMQALRSQVRRTTAALEQERIESLERFQKEFERLVTKHISERGLLVIFVDDLDRCLPDKAVEVLEAIKLFLDVPNCVFILGIDRDVVERGIRLRYGEMGRLGNRQPVQFQVDQEILGKGAGGYRAFLQDLYSGEGEIIDGRRYLEKIIQIPFVLPPMGHEKMGGFVAELTPNLPDERCGLVFVRGLEPNPRQVKRALNIFALLWTLAEHLPGSPTILSRSITPVRLAKLVVLQQRHPDLYKVLREEPWQLIAWERAARMRDPESGLAQEYVAWHREATSDGGTVPDTPLYSPDAELPKELEKYDDERLKAALYRLLTMHPISGPEAEGANFVDMSTDHAQELVFLSYSAEGRGEGPDREVMPEPMVETPEEESAEPPPEQKEASLRLSDWLKIPELEAGFILRRAVEPVISLVQEVEPGQEMADQLAQIGLEFMSQLPSYARTKDGKLVERLAGEKPLTVQVSFKDRLAPLMARLPWEIAYVGDQDPAVEKVRLTGFLGGRHIVERPLVPGAAEAAKEPVSLPSWLTPSDRPLRVFLLPPEKADDAVIGESFSSGFETDRVVLTRGQQLDDLWDTLRDGQADVYFIHARGTVDYGRVDLHWRSQSLDVKFLSAPLRKMQPADRNPCLIYLGCYGESQREVDWSAWLSTLAQYGAAGIVAPLFLAPEGEWNLDLSVYFFEELLVSKPVGKALLAARQRLFDESKDPLFDERKDPRGLLYVHFGSAAMQLFQGAQESSAGEPQTATE